MANVFSATTSLASTQEALILVFTSMFSAVIFEEDISAKAAFLSLSITIPLAPIHTSPAVIEPSPIVIEPALTAPFNSVSPFTVSLLVVTLVSVVSPKVFGSVMPSATVRVLFTVRLSIVPLVIFALAEVILPLTTPVIFPFTVRLPSIVALPIVQILDFAKTLQTSIALPFRLEPSVSSNPFAFKQPVIVASPLFVILFDVIVLASKELVIFTFAAFKVPAVRLPLTSPLSTSSVLPLMLPPIKEP